MCRNVKRTQTWMWECIFFFSFCRLWFLSSSSSTLDSMSWRISSNSCFRERRRTLISSASANSSVSAWSCSARIFFSSRSFRTKKQFENETFPFFKTSLFHVKPAGVSSPSPPARFPLWAVSPSLSPAPRLWLVAPPPAWWPAAVASPEAEV